LAEKGWYIQVVIFGDGRITTDAPKRKVEKIHKPKKRIVQ